MVATLSAIARTLKRAVIAAGAAAQRARRAGLTVKFKSEIDTSTSADDASEVTFKTIFNSEHPEIPVFGEESVTDAELAGAVPKRGIILDPLDGTRNFQAGQTGWGTMAAYLFDGQPVASAICQPDANLVMVADKDNGVFIGPADDSAAANQIVLPHEPKPDRLFGCIEVHRFTRPEDIRRGLLRFTERGLLWGNISAGTAADGTMLLLQRKVDFYLNLYGGKIWDFAAGACAVEIAGGSVFNAEAKPLRYDTWPMGVLFCANPGVSEIAVSVLSG